MEARLTPSVLAIAATVYCPEPYISWATRSLNRPGFKSWGSSTFLNSIN